VSVAVSKCEERGRKSLKLEGERRLRVKGSVGQFRGAWSLDC